METQVASFKLLKTTFISFIGFALMLPGIAQSHCDTMDGPVVAAAARALESGDMKPILIWIQKKDENEVKLAFQKALQVRSLSPEAKSLADKYFFETVVRIHRAGEGAPYTGLKPAGTDLGPAIPAADQALKTGKDDALKKLLTDAVNGGVDEHFRQTLKLRKFPPEDVAAGRKYVESYVQYVHYVERVFEASQREAHGHYAEGDEALK